MQDPWIVGRAQLFRRTAGLTASSVKEALSR